MIGAWCLLGDFNAVMYSEDRMGGNAVTELEVKELINFTESCGIQELPNSGPYFSWTNKTVRSRIDRVFINLLWYDSFDFTYTTYSANTLSDHTPLISQFHDSPKPKSQFQYCEMWSKHTNFFQLVESVIPPVTPCSISKIS